MIKKCILFFLLLGGRYYSHAQTFNATPSINAAGSANTFLGGYTFAYATSGSPWNGAFVSFGGFTNTYDCQINADYIQGNHISFRTRNGDNHLFNPWYEFWHSGNLNNVSSDFIARNVGIGTASPGVPLHIVKASVAATEIPMQRWDPVVTGGGYNLTLSNYNSVHGVDYRFTQLSNNVALSVLTFQGGNVAIGTTDPHGFKLAVNGSAIATSMTVQLNGSWPDYVFKPGYQLASLNKVKNYIDQYGHLPDLPSEQEVTQNGVNLGEINMLLTKKVEELTLYLIEQ